MKSVRQRQLDRAAFLIAAYQLAGGRRFAHLDMDEVATNSEVALEDGDEVYDLLAWMRDQGLIENETGGGFDLSAWGIDEAERLLNETEQAEAADAAIELSVTERQDVERFLLDYRRALDSDETLGGLDRETLAEIHANVETIQAQMRAPKPKKSIVRAVFSVLADIGKNAAGNAVLAGAIVLGKALS